MATKNKKVTTKLSTKKSYVSYLQSISSEETDLTIYADRFFAQKLSKETIDMIVMMNKETADATAKRISQEFQDANAKSGTSVQTVAKFQNWFEILVSKHLNENDEFEFNWNRRSPFLLSFSMVGIEQTLEDALFSKNWMFPKDNGRSYLTTKFKKADAIGSSLLRFNLEIYASLKKGDKNATVELSLLTQSEKLEILEQIKNKKQIKETKIQELSFNPDNDEFSSILEMMIARFKKVETEK